MTIIIDNTYIFLSSDEIITLFRRL